MAVTLEYDSLQTPQQSAKTGYQPIGRRAPCQTQQAKQ